MENQTNKEPPIKPDDLEAAWKNFKAEVLKQFEPFFMPIIDWMAKRLK